MFLIETYLKELPFKGISLFTQVDLKKGDVIWNYDLRFIKRFSKNEYKNMPKLQKLFLEKYAILQKDNSWELDLDNSRFINHSFNPNIAFTKDVGYCLENIQKDTELTCDYQLLVDKVNNINFQIAE